MFFRGIIQAVGHPRDGLMVGLLPGLALLTACHGMVISWLLLRLIHAKITFQTIPWRMDNRPTGLSSSRRNHPTMAVIFLPGEGMVSSVLSVPCVLLAIIPATLVSLGLMAAFHDFRPSGH